MSASFKQYAAAVAAVLAFALPARAALIVNGGFESGLAGWTAADQAGSDGSFLLQSGMSSPINGFAVPAAPEGSFAAMTDQQGGGSHVLYQDFMQATAVAAAVLRFDVFVGNLADDFHAPATLDWAGNLLNQQARVDILLGASDPFSLNPGDLLLNAFATLAGDPTLSGYQTVSIDITSLLNANLNTSLRLRFAEVDNVNFFNFGVDNVQIIIRDPNEVPEPGSWLLLLAGFGAAGLATRRALKR